MACPQLGVILAYWKQTGVSSPKNPIALAVGVSTECIQHTPLYRVHCFGPCDPALWDPFGRSTFSLSFSEKKTSVSGKY